MEFIKIISGLLTPLIAIVTVYIAIQQHRSNKKYKQLKYKLDLDNTQIEKNRLKIEEYKIRLDLYNKRYEIFKNTKDILSKIFQNTNINISELSYYSINTNESKFLFDDDILAFLEELKKNAINLCSFNDLLKQKGTNNISNIEQNELANKKQDLVIWFTNAYENIENNFEKYLSFKNL